MATTHPSITLAPEAELLLMAAAARPSVPAMRRLVAAGVDWPLLAALSQDANAAPVVFRLLAPLHPGVDDAELQMLRSHATLSVMRMLQLEQLLHQTLDVLAERGMEVMLLKGAALAYSVYPSFADRPMSDLDLLIRPVDQAEAAWSYLQTRGWTWPKTRWAEAQYTTLHHLPPLVQQPPAGGEGVEFRLEVHRELLPEGHPFRLSTDAIWATARTVTRNGRRFTVPALLHQLWHLCVHFAWSHGIQWGAWRTMRDVGMILAEGDLDWLAFVDLARESRAVTSCYWTLRLAQRVVGAPVPDSALVTLRPPRPEAILEKLERHYVSNFFPLDDNCPSVLLAHLLWEAGILPRWSGHGASRPWQVSVRWAAGAETPAAEPQRQPFRAQIARFGAWWRYLRRIQRLSLPRRDES